MNRGSPVGAPPKTARVLVIIGAVIFLGLAIAIGLLFWLNSEPPRQPASVPAALAWVGILALPAFVALLGVRRRDPRLLLPAIVTGLVPAMLTLFSVGLVLVVPALLWIQAATRWPTPKTARSWRRDLLPLTIPILAILAGLTFFAHQDPACWNSTKGVDGHITYTRTALNGARESGWFAGGESASISSGGDGVTGSICTSDRVTPLEGLIALGFIAGAEAVALKTTRAATDSSTAC
ncbi:hypothetical protein BMS3Abin02_00977 [bacterium BMS3Abin02]|nr:hypothetical protein BMS3Abin02_00977 [bacterium BMS3Abin02]